MPGTKRSHAVYCSRKCKGNALSVARRATKGEAVREYWRGWRARNRGRLASYRGKSRDERNAQRRIQYAERVYGTAVPVEEMTRDRYRKARAQGYRSGLEVSVAQQLTAAGVPFEYETLDIPYIKKPAKYKPDVLLPNGIIVELKGHMPTEDRTKHRLVRAQHPDLDIRLVFSNPGTRISKQSKTTYAKWADYVGIPWAGRTVPDAWLREPPNERSLAAIARLKEAK